MELENKPMSPAPLLVVLASFDPNGNGINDCDENNPAPLTDKTSPLYGEQWCFSTPAEVYDRFFGGKYSLTAYYNELSANKFTFYPVKIDHMQEGGLEAGVLSVAVKLPHPAALRNLEGYDNGSAAAKAIAEIVKACDPYIDFAKYDSDGDGIVNPTDLAIVILNAGFDHSSTKGDLEFSKVDYENAPDALHRFMVHGTSQPTDVTMRGGVKVVRVSNMGEYRSKDTGLISVGTPAHELAHNLGAQDMYSRYTPPAQAEKRWPTPGRYSLMSSGNHIKAGAMPSYPDPYQRIYFGWAEETNVYENGVYTLHSTLSGKYNVLRINTPDPDEYFLCEIRLKEGFEEFLNDSEEKGGILIWHIDETINKEWFLRAQCVSSNLPDGKRHDLGNALLLRKGREVTEDGRFGPLFAESGESSPFFYKSEKEETSVFESDKYCGSASLSYSLNSFPDGVSPDFKVRVDVLDAPGGEMRVKVTYSGN